MITLAIDTSAGTSVAVLRGDKILAEVNHTEPMKHAEQIGQSIQEALGAAGTAAKDVKLVALGRGPAPFTGLRVGMAAGIMFAEGVGAECYGVVSLDALALQLIQSGVDVSAQRPLLITADARRSEVYWALYSGLNPSGAPVSVEGPSVMKPAELDDYLTNKNIHPVRAEASVSAGALGQVLAAQLIAGTATKDLSALYLRAADAVAPVSNRLAGKKVSS